MRCWSVLDEQRMRVRVRERIEQSFKPLKPLTVSEGDLRGIDLGYSVDVQNYEYTPG